MNGPLSNMTATFTGSALTDMCAHGRKRVVGISRAVGN